jgi:hypothetical protein
MGTDDDDDNDATFPDVFPVPRRGPLMSVCSIPAHRAHDALVAAVRRLIEAFDACDGNRGRFSCVDAHDCRCPKARAASPDQWRGEWRCECGAEALDAAINEASAALARVAPRDE